MVLQNLLNNAGRAFEQAKGSENGDRDMVTENRFDSWTGGNLVDGEFVELAYFTVPAQTGYTWGYGEPAEGKSDNQGRIYFDALSTDENADGSADDVVGRIRLESRNAVGKNKEDHGTFHTSELEQTLTDRRTWPFLPEANMPIIGEDSQLVMQFEYDSSASVGTKVDQTNSTFRASVTEFTLA